MLFRSVSQSRYPSQEGRDAILKDIQKQLEQFDKIASGTNYNGQTLLQKSSTDNSASDVQQFQSGLKGEQLIETSSVQSNTEGLGLTDLANQNASTFTSSEAKKYLETVDDAINSLNDTRSNFGSVQNQLESSSRNLLTQQRNTKILITETLIINQIIRTQRQC